MSLIDDVTKYEKWLGEVCDVVKADLKKKHKRMTDDPLMFFRATCFRFARTITPLLPQVVDAPKAPSVGDAHIENFGTWRDAEGRLVWGINDFDEAASLPYTLDLARLATSAHLATGLSTAPEVRTQAILDGYRKGLGNPAPCFVNEGDGWMVKAVANALEQTHPVSADLAELDTADPPKDVRRLLSSRLPEDATILRFGTWHRPKGGGSLGRPRYVAAALWHCGPAIREAKALAPSAWDWAAGKDGGKHLFKKLSTGRYRSPDPFLDVEDGYVVRCVANDATKIEVSNATADKFEPELFSAMGADLAAIHLDKRSARDAIIADLATRPDGWLDLAAKTAAADVQRDYATWCTHYAAKRAEKGIAD